MAKLHFTLLAVVSVVIVGRTATARPTVTFDATLALLFDGLSFSDMQPETPTSGRGTFHLTLFDTPRDRDGAAYAKVVVSLAPLCLAANKANVSEVSLGTLGNVLLGLTIPVYRVALGVVASSPASKQLLTSLNDQGVAGFDSAVDWPARVKANSNIVWFSSDAALSAYIASHTGVMGPQGAVLTTAASMECLRIRMTSPNGDSLSFSPTFANAKTQAATLIPEDAHVFTQGMTYPLMGGLMVTAPVNTSCTELDTLRQLLLYLYTNASVSLLSRGAFAADIELQFETLVTLHHLISSACPTSGLAFTIAGDLTAYDAVAAFTLNSVGGDMLVEYNDNYGNPNVTDILLGQTAMGGSTSPIAFIDSPTRATVDAMRGEVLVAPLFSVAMAVAYNLDGAESLAASPCTLLGLLNGTIAYWDDLAVQRDNVGVVLPHLKVTRMVNPSSTIPSLIRGLNVIYSQCVPGAAATDPFDVAVPTWPFLVDEEVVFADTHTAVEQVSGALCLLPVPVAVRFSLQVLSYKAARGVHLLPNDLAAGVVIDAAQLDARTHVVVMPPHGPMMYPFVAALHVAFRASYEGRCTEVVAAFNFIDRLMSAEGLALVDITGYTLFPPTWRAETLRAIRQVSCDGVAVFPSADVAAAFSTGAEVGTAVGSLVVVMVAIAGLLAARFGGSRSHAYAPKDEAKPFAVVFTDIQSSTALWAAVPEDMGPALDQHHAVIREAIAATGGYEVKTIGDSFMVAFKTARAAVSFGVLVQKLLHDSTWSPVFDEFYFHEAQENVDAAVAAQYDTVAGASLWNGLRVRIGVHYGIGQIKLDPVTNAYDYYGTVVNTAARVEAVGHGGQVCVTSAALHAASADGALPSAVVSDLGLQELRGLSEPIHLHQVAPRELNGRVFPLLRLNKASHDEDVVVQETADPTRSAHSSSAGEQRSACSSNANAAQDDLVQFFSVAALLSQGRLQMDDLAAQFGYTKVLLRTAGAFDSSKRGRSASGKSETAILRQCCEQWRISREPEGSHEQRVAKSSGGDVLQLCKLVVRVAAAASNAKHTTVHRSSLGYWEPSAGGRQRTSWSSAAKYSVNEESKPDMAGSGSLLPGQQFESFEPTTTKDSRV